jgi:hypothetical protein
MTADAFWEIMAEARRSTHRASEIPDWLVERLSRLEESEIVAFQSRMRDCMYRSYDAHLWLGAVIVLGRCGDDSFDYFRAWLISQGREAFESALADTDSLAGLESFDGEYGVPRLERMLYAPAKAFLRRVGGDDIAARERFESLLPPGQHPPLRNQELVNTRVEDARVFLPKLAARFPTPIRGRNER